MLDIQKAIEKNKKKATQKKEKGNSLKIEDEELEFILKQMKEFKKGDQRENTFFELERETSMKIQLLKIYGEVSMTNIINYILKDWFDKNPKIKNYIKKELI